MINIGFNCCASCVSSSFLISSMCLFILMNSSFVKLSFRCTVFCSCCISSSFVFNLSHRFIMSVSCVFTTFRSCLWFSWFFNRFALFCSAIDCCLVSIALNSLSSCVMVMSSLSELYSGDGSRVSPLLMLSSVLVCFVSPACRVVSTCVKSTRLLSFGVVGVMFVVDVVVINSVVLGTLVVGVMVGALVELLVELLVGNVSLLDTLARSCLEGFEYCR